MTPLWRQIFKSSGILLAYAFVGTAILAAVYAMTHTAIEKNDADAQRKLVAETLIPHSYNNDLIASAVHLPRNNLLGNDAKPAQGWQARMNQTPIAIVLPVTAPNGYGGAIQLLVGISNDGQITGVRVVEHHETPGLGDYIDIAKSQWIHIFDGKSLRNTPDEAWQVKKDGGEFDYVTGATITPRAVIAAVHRALQYASKYHTQLFAPATGAKP